MHLLTLLFVSLIFPLSKLREEQGTRAEVGVCFSKNWSCLSKFLPFSLIEVHYQYCKGCNLSISLNKAVNWSNSGLTKRDRDENVHCGGME